MWGAEHATSATTLVVRAVTQLGGTMLIVPMAVVLTVVEYRRLPNRSLPVFVLLIVVGQLVIVNLIKVAVARIRPDIDPLASFSGASFPSGHTTAAASFAAAAALVLGRGRPLRVRAILAGAAVGDRGRGGRVTGAARRPLVQRRAGRPRVGMELVRDPGDRVRRAPHALRRSGGGRAGGGTTRARILGLRSEAVAPHDAAGAPDQGRAVSSASVQGYAVRDRRARSA